MHVVLEAPASALDLCKDGSKVVVAGRSVFKIFSVEEEFVERDNLRVGKNINLNFSCNDVVWSPVDDQVIATAATNGIPRRPPLEYHYGQQWNAMTIIIGIP